MVDFIVSEVFEGNDCTHNLQYTVLIDSMRDSTVQLHHIFYLSPQEILEVDCSLIPEFQQYFYMMCMYAHV